MIAVKHSVQFEDELLLNGQSMIEQLSCLGGMNVKLGAIVFQCECK